MNLRRLSLRASGNYEDPRTGRSLEIVENESDLTAVESFQEFSRPHRSAGRFPRRSLQVLERRYGTSESWGRFPDARARLLRVLAAAAAPALLISGDLCGIPTDSRYLQRECSETNFWGLSLSSRRELGERIRTVQESWETSSM